MKKWIGLVGWAILLAAFLVFPMATNTGIAGDDRVVLVGGGEASKSLDDFITNASVIGEGNVWYVDSNQATAASGDGKSWDFAVLTVDEAINLATASNGDVIYVAAHHNENGAAADMFDVDKAGITIIGFGVGSAKPTFDFDVAAVTVAVGAADVTLKNLRFRPGTGSIVTGVDVESGANYATFLGCDFGYQEAATDEFLIAININTASGVTVDGCLFDAGDDDTADCAIKIIWTAPGTTIKNSIMKGEYATSCIRGITIAMEDLLIDNNFLYNGDTADGGDLAAQPVIELLTGSTGIISNNKVFCNLVYMTASIVCDGAFLHENYYSEDITLTTKLIGTQSDND